MARYGGRSGTWTGPFLGIGLLLAFAVISWAWIDRPLVAWINALDRSWYSRGLVQAYVQLGKGWVLLWLVAFAVACRGMRPGPIAVLAALVFAGVLVGPIKPLAGRVRPGPAIALQQDKTIVLSPSQRHSFPSGDAAAAFAAAVAAGGLVHRWKAAVMLAGASVIAALRVISLNHYPSDVLAGAAIGVLAGYIGARIAAGWYLPHPVHQGLLVRLAGGLVATAITVVSILAEDRSSVLLFLRYFGPVLGLVLAWELVGQYRKGRIRRLFA